MSNEKHGRAPVDVSVIPARIQLSRRKGWRIPANTVNVSRPGRFGNPFKVTEERSQAEAVSAFRLWLTMPHCTAGIPEKKAAILSGLKSLCGKDLACWCKPGTPCHADVLIELANMDRDNAGVTSLPHTKGD